MARKKKNDEESTATAEPTDAEVTVAPPPELSFEIQASELQSALAMVHRAVPNRTVLPVLSNILIQSDGVDQLRLSGTNLELAVNLFIKAKVHEPGAITLPAKALLDTVNTLPKEALVKVKVTIKNQSAEIRAMSRRVKLLGIDAMEFPLTHYELSTSAFELPGSFLADVKNVIPAAAQDEARPVLTVGALFLSEDGKLRMEAADGFRLHRDILQTEAGGQTLTMLIPARAIKEVCSVMDSEKVVIVDRPAGQGRTIFQQGPIQMVLSEIEGNFPDLSAVIPKEANTKLKITLSRKALITSIKSTGLFGKAAAHTLLLKPVAGTEQEPGYLNLKMTGAEVGEFEDRVDAVLDGEPITFAVNSTYLREGLECLEKDMVTIQIQGQTAPILIVEDDFTLVVMPMHIGK